METIFQLEDIGEMPPGKVHIINSEADKANLIFKRAYIKFQVKQQAWYFLKDDELERFAVNILKALKSKKLKTLS